MKPNRVLLPLLLATCALLATRAAQANVVVTIQSVLGPIDLELFDQVAPLTVANFLAYTDSAAYDDSFIHRSVPLFVIQGGGFKVIGGQIANVATNPPSVLNEPGLSNVRGTVAMAKIGGQPDSATTQWFVNVGNNTPLDTDNGGFTVFADVISGMAIVDQINALVRVNAGGAFAELPTVGWTPPNPVVVPTNLVMLSDVSRRTTPLCGDLNADAQINGVDVARVRAALANPGGSALSPAEAARCSVAGTSTDCNVVDTTVVRRRLAGRGPLRAQICPAAL
ncbi:MAG: peptidylprolyl isomerase [Myxococcota bacterium]